MKLVKDVVLEDGRILLLKGFTIKPRYLNKLKVYNVPFIYVEDDIVELEEISEERVYEDAFSNIKDIMESIRYDEKVDIEELKETVDDMVQHILNDDMVFMTLTGIRDIDNYTFLHSVDVCIYSVITAKALNINNNDIYELALAAILHDVGKCKIPLSILNKLGKLTTEEFEVMKHHSIKGFEIVGQIPGISERIARVICQHHEKWNGSGYPLGLKNYDIELWARIISISDVYDALTSRRPYKEAVSHDEAISIMKQEDGKFDPVLINLFYKNADKFNEVREKYSEKDKIMTTAEGIA